MNQTKTDGYILTIRQIDFIRKANKAGHKVYYDYSGRGMFGRKCPAYNCDNANQIMQGYSSDNMGTGYVVYCT